MSALFTSICLRDLSQLASGREIGFDGLVVATGASPRRLPSLEAMDGVVTIRSVEHAIDLRRRLAETEAHLVVVGGGFLGMEVAATARRLGARVTVIEPLPAPLSRVLGEGIGTVIAGMHRDHGVEVRTSTGVEAVVGDGHVEAVILSDGSEVPADVVLVAIGVVPETSWLEGSGLRLDDGVVCEASLVCARLTLLRQVTSPAFRIRSRGNRCASSTARALPNRAPTPR